MENIVVLTGAGISAESGVKTFRDQDGLWKNHRIEEVASPYAWEHNPALVLEFYNQRRKQLFEVEPNAAHYALVKLESKYNVEIITQNVDDLHERAGSKNVLHLHGELKKVRSTVDESIVYEFKQWKLKIGEKCEKGSQLRPHIVWFGEPVPNFEIATEIASKADIFLVIGTSMVVYPAAGLIHYVPENVSKYVIDPNAKEGSDPNLTIIRKKAGESVPELVEKLLKKLKMRILIVCTGNSCRSQMAEYFLKSFDPNMEVYSAGSEPEKRVNPRTVKVMDEIGIDLSDSKPKNVDVFLTDTFDYVITVCDNARENCPVFMGTVKNRLHMGFEDPAKATGTEQEVMDFYRKVRDEIKDGFYEFYLKIKD